MIDPALPYLNEAKRYRLAACAFRRLAGPPRRDPEGDAVSDPPKPVTNGLANFDARADYALPRYPMPGAVSAFGVAAFKAWLLKMAYEGEGLARRAP